MQSFPSTELADTISDRGMGTRYRFETRLTPDDGEKALGGEIALKMWANAGTKAMDPQVFQWMTEQWLPKFVGVKDVKLVRGRKYDEQINTYYMIGDIKKGIEMLRSNTEFGISGGGADDLLRELAKAEQKKAEMDKAPPRSLPNKTKGRNPKRESED